MSEKVVITKKKLDAIGDALREKREESIQYPLDDMPQAIRDIQGGGGDFTISDASYLFYGGARINNYESIMSLLKDVTNTSYMFFSADDNKVFEDLDLSMLDTSKVTNMNSMFRQLNISCLDISSLDTGNVTDMSYMFNNMSVCKSIIFGEKFDTSKVTNMSNMFYNNGIENIDLSIFNTSKCTNMSSMFGSCQKLSGTLNFDTIDTSLVTDMSSIFSSCRNIEEILNLSAPKKAGITIGFPNGTSTTRYALKRLTFKTDLPEGVYSIRSAISIKYCSIERSGMIEMFNSLPDITAANVGTSYKKITITGNPCLTGILPDGTACETLTDEDRAIATAKGWTLVE